MRLFYIKSSLLLSAFLFAVSSTAQVSGIVYRDFNANGARSTTNPIEPVLAGITVKAYNSAGVEVGTTTSSATGAYSFTGLTLPLRIEFSDFGTDYYSGPSGTGNASSVQFYTAASTTANFGVNYPADYCQSTNPNMLSAQYTNGDPLAGGTSGSRRCLITFDYNSAGNATGDADLAPLGYTNDPVTFSNATSTTGPVWGLAYQRSKKRAFAAAFIKRHQGIGPLGEGGIYSVSYAAGAPVVSNFIDVNTIGINTGQVGVGATPTLRNANRGLSAVTTTPNPSGDPQAFDAVGKVGLGDLDISDDESTLYVINLFDQKLYAILIDSDNNPSTAPTASDVTVYSLPTNPCSAGTLRPFAVKFYRGNVYVGAVCDASLEAYIYKLEGASFVSVQVNGAASIPLTYTKGQATSSNGCNTAPNNGWFTWFSTPPTACDAPGSANELFVRPSPILCDIEFDVDGSMIISFIDRAGHQFGAGNTQFDGSGFETVHSAGDILRICNVGGNFVMQGGSGCANNLANTQGPGGGEFYSQDFLNFPQGGGLLHQETTVGGMALLPGRNEVAVTCFDPFGGPFLAGGVNWFSNTTGASRPQGYFVYFGTAGSLYNSGDFSKAAGMGDIELLCDPAPIEIGNRVWLDTNQDGKQDANEVGIASQTVQLYRGSTLVGTTTTDSNGNYYFNNANVTQNGATGILPNEAYEVRISTGSAFLVTALNTDGTSNGDLRDNDATGTTTAVIPLTTGAYGENNHTYDFGFVCVEPSISATYTQATCPVTGITPNNTATLKVDVVGGDKVAVSISGVPTTTYAASSALVAGSFTFTAQNGAADTFYVRVWNGAVCFKDTIIKVTPVRCCPTMTFGTPVTNTAYCSGATVPAFTVSTNAIAPDSVRFYMHTNKQTTYQGIVSSGGQVMGTRQITGVAATATNTATLSNFVLPENLSGVQDTLWIYGVYVDRTGDTICKVFIEKSILLNTEPIASISGFDYECNGTAVTLTASAATTYRWGRMPAATTLATTQTYTVTPTASSTNTYWLVTTNALTCASDTAYHTITASSGVFGTAFRDFNSNGTQDAAETVGLAGIQVYAYDCDNNVIATAFTDSDGRYSFPTLTPSMGKVRIEFNKATLPSYYQESFSGADNGTDVQYVTAPDCAVDWGVKEVGDFCQTNPMVISPRAFVGTATIAENALPGIYYNAAASATPTMASLALNNEIGATWGLAYSKLNRTIYNSSVVRSFMNYGASGSFDKIYAYRFSDPNQDAAPVATSTLINTIDLSSLGVNMGTDPRPSPMTGAGPQYDDTNVYMSVGKSGIGDIDINDNGDTLYVINMNNAAPSLVVINVASPTSPVLISENVIAGPGCTGGTFRPWAIKRYQNKVFIGGVCDGATSNTANLDAYVYQWNGGTSFTLVANMPLDYNRAKATFRADGTFSNADWRVWTDTWAPDQMPLAPEDLVSQPQPILSDIEFTDEGAMILAFADRFAFQTAYQQRQYGLTTGPAFSTVAAGDIVKLCKNGVNYEVEGTVAACSRVNVDNGSVTTLNTISPNILEFFDDDYYNTGSSATGQAGHSETTLGGLAYLPGRLDILSSNFDPITTIAPGGASGPVNTSGIRFYNPDGSYDKGWVTVSATGTKTNRKGGAMGDLEILCDAAPIQIGNYVWLDNNADGLQQSCEAPLANVVVSLWKDGVQIASTTTNANGEYYFSSKVVLGTAWTGTGADTTLLPNTNYEVRINTATYPSNTLTTSNVASPNDQTDNDATLVAGFATIALTTGPLGSVNHTYDFGFTCTQPIVSFVYTPATCPVTGITPNNNATLQITAPGADKIAMSTTGVPTTTYAAATALTLGSFTYTAQNGSIDSFYVRVWAGATCIKDTLIVVNEVRCCPTMTFGTPVTNTAYCSGATVPAFTVSTNAIAPDSVRFYLHTSKKTTYNDIVDGSGQVIAQRPITGVAATVTNTATLSNFVLPQNISGGQDTLWIYGVYVDNTGDTICKILIEKSILLNPEPVPNIQGADFVCNGTAVTMTSDLATTYRWGRSPLTTTLATTQSYTVTPTNNTTSTYWLVTTNSNGCASDTAYHNITSGSGISGTAFRDFNSNGVKETNEKFGTEGIKVYAYNCAGEIIDSTTTGENGFYSFPNLTAADGKLRIEFSVPSMPSWLQQSFAGADNETDVQFVTAPNCGVDFGVKESCDYCNTNPRIAFPIISDTRSFISNTYNAATGTAAGRNEATLTQTGILWGLAYKGDQKRLFASAELKRNLAFGPQGIGGVYVFDYSSPTSTSLASSFSLQGVVPTNGGPAIDLGSVTRVSTPITSDFYVGTSTHTFSIDLDAFGKVGAASYGDIDFDETGKNLWLVNLNQRALIKMDASGALPGAAAQYPIVGAPGVPTCVSGEIRPWALAFNKGKGYLGVVCDASISQNKADLAGYVLSFDPENIEAGFTVELNVPLNYVREAGQNDVLSPSSPASRHDATWKPWANTWAQTGLPNAGRLNYAQPIISDIEFTEDGSMSLGLINRFNEQANHYNAPAVSAITTGIEVINTGDILKACKIGNTFVIESNSGCPLQDIGPVVVDGISGNGEFYYGDRFSDGTNVHGETTGGALAVLKGTNEIITSAYDPISIFGQGVIFLNTQTGAKADAWQVQASNSFGPGKGNGVGDIEVLCDAAPIQIGNYVWIDDNQDGIQDPCELPVANVKVYLYTATGVLVDSTVTSATGNYYFSSTTDSLKTNTDYVLVFGGTSQFNTSTSSLTVGANQYSLTEVNSGTGITSDQNDSDASTVTPGTPINLTGLPVIKLTTGGPGYIDHTFDVGLIPYVPCVNPIFNVAVVTPNCGVANSNGQISVSTATNADKFGVSAGATYTGPAYATASSMGALPQIVQSSIPNTGGTYTIRLFNGLNTCFKDTTIIVEPIVPPTAVVTGNQALDCTTTSTTLTATGGGTYLWSDGSVTAASNAITTPGIYTVTVTDGNGCTDTETTFVSQNITPPTVDITGNVTLNCSVKNTVLTASGGGTYSWSDGSTNAASNSISAAGTFTVTVTSANGCTATSQKEVTVNATNAQPVLSDINVCPDTTATLNPGTFASYAWSSGETTQTVVKASGTYTVTVTDDTGCTGTTKATIIQLTLPSLVLEKDTVCENKLTTLDAGDFLVYYWNNGETTRFIDVPTGTYTVTVHNDSGCSISASVTVAQYPNPNVVLQNVGICPTDSTVLDAGPFASYFWSTNETTQTIKQPVGLYSVVVTDNNGCSAYAEVQVTSLGQPNVSLSNILVCPGKTGDLTASSATSYAWNTGETTQTVAQVAGTYTVTVTDSNSCSASTSATISEFIPTVATISGMQTICEGDSLTLTAFGVGTFLWSTNATTQTVKVGPSVTSNYSVTLTDANGCTDTESATIDVTSKPDAGQDVVITCPTGNAPPPNTYNFNLPGTWQIISQPANASVDANGLVIGLTKPGIYTLQVTVNNCTDEVTITQSDCCIKTICVPVTVTKN